MPYLGPDDPLPADVVRAARNLSYNLGSRLHYLSAHVSREDVEQECLLAAWVFLRSPASDQVEHPTGAYLSTVMRRRAIDWMRVHVYTREDSDRGRALPTAPIGRPGPDGPEVDLILDMLDLHHRSGHQPDDPHREVEDRDAIQRAIDTYPGPAWHSELALLHAYGATLAQLGQAYGFTESRACQVYAEWCRATRNAFEADDVDVARSRGRAS